MAPPTSPAIIADGVAAAYGERLIWRNASFTVNTGEFVAVLGPNGGGKSTLLRLLLGLLSPAAGRLHVLGENPRRGNPAIGYVPQRRHIDQDVAIRGRDFVHLGVDGNRWGFGLGRAVAEAEQRVDSAIRAVDALTYADRPIGRLSGGEQQRVAVARALANNPSVILADEPTGNLDSANSRRAFELLQRIVQEERKALLLVTHNPEIAEACDWIHEMQDGLIVGSHPRGRR